MFFYFYFQDAILALNGLQSNADTVKKSINEGPMQYRQHAEETELYLHRIGISMNDLDRLSVIHVAGTKGKVRKKIKFSNRLNERKTFSFLEYISHFSIKGFNLCFSRINTSEFEYQNWFLQFTASIKCYGTYTIEW